MKKLDVLGLVAVVVGVGVLTGCGPGLTSKYAKSADEAGSATVSSAPVARPMVDDLPYGEPPVPLAAHIMRDDQPWGPGASESQPAPTWGEATEASPPPPNPYH